MWPEGITSAEAATFANVSRRSRVKGARYAHEKLRLELRAAKVLAGKAGAAACRPPTAEQGRHPRQVRQFRYREISRGGGMTSGSPRVWIDERTSLGLGALYGHAKRFRGNANC